MWKIEYLDGCSTIIKYVVRKVGLYNWEIISLWGCNFWISGLTYDIYVVFGTHPDIAYAIHVLSKFSKILE